MEQVRLQPGKLLDKKGRLLERGYATSLVRDYDRRDIRAGALRIKEWDYYIVYNEDYGVAMTLDDNSYMGLISATFLDFRNRTEHTVSPMTILPMGRTGLPSSSKQGDAAFHNSKVSLEYKNDGRSRRLLLDMKDFDEGMPFTAEIELTDEPRDCMVIATPFPKNEKAFYYNQKIIGMRAKGNMTYKGKTYEFKPENSFGIMDWGRGVWTYENTWYWGAGQGLVNGKVFGFNIGYGFGDTSAATENMLFYEGIAHKLDNIEFIIPKDKSGSYEFMKPWIYTSSDGRFEMDFTPCLDRKSYTSLGIILSDQHQVFGYFDGNAVLDDGTKLHLEHFLGFAEVVRNKW
ncbi:MAG: DUF2804 domain-containing protein [Clostridiales bacterium]|nr:DUF2804 domain-containing protein [Clostridiales bacterium]